MRVLEGVVHVADYQIVVGVCSRNDHFFALKISLFEQF
jgi:hypothetical protein